MTDLPAPEELTIITFPHPTLRYKAKPVKRVDKRLKSIVSHMFELMYEHRGVGLAATQVNLPLRLFVMNPTGSRDEGPEMVFINPIISSPKSSEVAEEGCLSLPGIHGNVVRSKAIHVNAFDLAGKEIDQTFTGFEARVIQHETDHLDGALFIDRLKDGAEMEIEGELDALVTDFRSKQRTDGIAADEVLVEKMQGWEAEYC
ncbi:MAG: peptide deformylase [Aureliella sp.]